MHIPDDKTKNHDADKYVMHTNHMNMSVRRRHNVGSLVEQAMVLGRRGVPPLAEHLFPPHAQAETQSASVPKCCHGASCAVLGFSSGAGKCARHAWPSNEWCGVEYDY
jgi:hypothetical protein